MRQRAARSGRWAAERRWAKTAKDADEGKRLPRRDMNDVSIHVKKVDSVEDPQTLSPTPPSLKSLPPPPPPRQPPQREKPASNKNPTFILFSLLKFPFPPPPTPNFPTPTPTSSLSLSLSTIHDG